MAPSRRNFISTAVVTMSATLATASPAPQYSGNVNTNMPFLPTSAPVSAASQWTQPTAWWTPEASQSEWNWSTWSASQAAASSSKAAAISSSVVVAATAAAGWTQTTAVGSTQTTPAYSNPFTIYTTMTNSNGVITGMPAVVTSQPTQAAVVTVCSGCPSVLSNEASWKSSVASMSTTAKAASANSTISTMSSSTVSTSRSASSSGFQQSQHTGAASRNNIAESGAALLAVGAFAMLL